MELDAIRIETNVDFSYNPFVRFYNIGSEQELSILYHPQFSNRFRGGNRLVLVQVLSGIDDLTFIVERSYNIMRDIESARHIWKDLRHNGWERIK